MIKLSNIGIFVISEGGRRENGTVIFEEIFVENFSKIMKDINSSRAKNFREQWAELIYPQNTLGHILFELKEHKDRIY